MKHSRELDGEEWSCLQCGHVEYGEGFEPLDLPEDQVRRREPSHGKVRL